MRLQIMGSQPTLSWTLKHFTKHNGEKAAKTNHRRFGLTFQHTHVSTSRHAEVNISKFACLLFSQKHTDQLSKP